MYAHTKEELPPGFKCTQCTNFATGHCRKSLICQFAHGEEEQAWFTKFMAGMDPNAPATTPSPALAALKAGIGGPLQPGVWTPNPMTHSLLAWNRPTL
jgi:hypothetical protein